MSRYRRGRVVVVGSANIDLVASVTRFPEPGETLLGSGYQLHNGGKGANQAVAAARCGAPVSFLGRVGRDAFGDRLSKSLSAEGIDTTSLLAIDAPTGAAFITVNDEGENTIVVAPGANARLEPQDLPGHLFEDAAVVVLQHEIPPATVRRAIDLGTAAGAMVIVNAAPAGALSLVELARAQLLVVNESEAATLLRQVDDDSHGRRTGPSSPAESEPAVATPHDPQTIVRELARYVPQAVLTLGPAGVVWFSESGSGELPSLTVDVVDTTAAGDAFVGALAARLAAGDGLGEAVRWGTAAGAVAVTRHGAQPSLPTREEIMAVLP